jgi:diguanylate cyclase (GGDEF)-like protein
MVAMGKLDAVWMARALPAAWLGGSGALLAVLLGGGAGDGNAGALIVIDAAGWTVAIALLLGVGRYRHLFELTQYIGIAIVSALVWFSGDPGTPFALLFVWLALQAAYFGPWPRALPQAIAGACGYAAGLAGAADGAFPWARWVLMGATLCAIGGLVAYLRMQVDALVGRLTVAGDTDELTGLGNRRKLLVDLDAALVGARPDAPVTLAMFDLNGFKGYNDNFGRPAGGSLLMRMGGRLADSVRGEGTAYRLGGDEFCVIVRGDAPGRAAAVRRASAALAERGGGFELSASCGDAQIPAEATTAAAALHLADGRLYQQKIVHEPGHADLVSSMAMPAGEEGVARALATPLGARLGLEGEDLDVLARSAELQNIGKIAIPEELLRRDGPFTADELDLLRRHVLIGERLLQASEPLGPVASVVRASRERWDGKGYPDGLAGEEIPLASRIIAVCQAFETLIDEDNPRGGLVPGAALAELRRSAGTRFEPSVVQALGVLIEEEQRAAAPSRPEQRRAAAG